jgi:phosphohistidine phosphatase
MQLLVIRHGIAEDGGGGDDAQRALTEEGKRKMKKGAAGLREIVETIDVIAASPLVRAQQTAEIVAKEYGKMPVLELGALVPGSDLTEVKSWLQELESAKVVAVVGHEPHLGTLVTWFLTGGSNSRVEMSKGGAALLEFSSRIREGSATLRWLLTGSQLRRFSA